MASEFTESGAGRQQDKLRALRKSGKLVLSGILLICAKRMAAPVLIGWMMLLNSRG